MAAVVFLSPAGCGEDPTSADSPTLSLDLAGRVVVPAPVEGARVRVLLPDGSTIAEGTTTDGNGYFVVTLSGVHSGDPVFVVADGADARYRDSWSSTTHQLGDDGQLQAVYILDESLSEHPLVIDPWSTMAAALARAYRESDSVPGLANNSWVEVVPLAAIRIASHLAVTQIPDLRFTDPLNPEAEKLHWPGAKAALGLSLAGLSRIAAAHSPADGDPVTSVQAAAALSADLSDGLLDGHGNAADGTSELVLLAGKPLTTETTRYNLAQAIHQFIVTQEIKPADLPDFVAHLGRPGGLFEHISTDAGALYPPGEPQLFDPLPPVLARWLGR